LKWRHEPILFVVTGPSGSGKGTVMASLLREVSGLKKAVTYTTRPPRPGEKDGLDYHFISEEELWRKIRTGDIFEYERVYGDHYYGSPSHIFTDECDRLIELEYMGHRKYRERFPDLVSMFIVPPSVEVLTERIKGRAEEPNLESRLKNAEAQLVHVHEYDYVLPNDQIERCIVCARSIIEAERCRRSKREALRFIERTMGCRQSGGDISNS